MSPSQDPVGHLRRLVLSGRQLLVMSYPGQREDPGEAVRDTVWRSGRHADFVEVLFGSASARLPPMPWHRRPVVPDPSAWVGMPAHYPDGFKGTLLPSGQNGQAVLEQARRAWGGQAFAPGSRLAAGPAGTYDAARLAADLLGPVEPDRIEVRPVLDIAGVRARRGVVAVACGSPLIENGEERAYYTWLALACVESAERAGRPGPILIGDGKYIERIAKMLGWPVQALGRWSLACPRDDVAGRSDDFRGERAWRARIEARLAGAVAEFRDGVWSMEGEGRRVLGIQTGPDGSPRGRPHEASALLVAVDPGPFVTGARMALVSPLDEADMAALVEEAWLAGLDGLAVTQGITRVTPRPTTLPFVRPLTEFVTAPGIAALRERLRGFLGDEGMRFQRAVVGGTANEPLQLWAAMPGGDSSRRRQFVTVFPALSELALDGAVTQAVDAGRSPLPRLQAILGASRALVRRLAGQEFRPELGIAESLQDWGRLGTFLESLGHGRVPPSDQMMEWYRLSAVATRAYWLFPNAHDLPSADLARLIAGIPGRDWAERHARFEAIGDATLHGIRDFVGALSLWLRDLSDRGGRVDGTAVLRDYGSLPRLAQASQLWHAHPILSHGTGRISPSATWPVPFTSIDLGDGWTATALPSAAALVAEGTRGPDADGMDGLAHCVATYAEACHAGRSLVVSLRLSRDGITRRVSTLELAPLGPDAIGEDAFAIGKRCFRLVQHRAFGNGEPPAGALSAAERLRQALHAAGDSLEGTFGALSGTPVEGRIPAADLLPHWRRILPRPWSRLDHETLAEAVLLFRR